MFLLARISQRGHGAWVDCCLKLAVPTGLCKLTHFPFLEPFPSSIDSGAHWPVTPKCLDLLVLPILTSLRSFPFPWYPVPCQRSLYP